MKTILWEEDGWTSLQDADAKKHILEISCRADKGEVVEIRLRHNDGEEEKGSCYLDGKDALPMNLNEFKKLFLKGKFEFK